MCGTLCGVAERYEIHNDSSGSAGNSAQIGINHGNIWMTGSSGALGINARQAELVQTLAGAVRKASGDELAKWGIRGRDALSVRWDTAAPDLFDYWEKIHGSAAPVSLAGQFSAIRKTYESVESKRLVILGRAGAGKTVLAHRLILDLLDDGGTAHAGRVPVLFSLSDWNPATDLRCWLAEHLVRDFPFLDAQDAVTGKRQAEVFVDRGLILPVLDGFDEIPGGGHRAAIGQISNLDMPLVVTSRPDEYGEAARGIKTVGGAAAIQLDDLTRDEAGSYLRQSTSKPRASAWDVVFEYLHTAPNETASRNLAAVLTTPLMVMLARTVYNDIPNDPGELLNDERFPTTAALEDHLLAAYLATVYARRDTGPRSPRRPSWTPGQARRWLGYLATHLHDRNTHDLTWWQLPATLHRHTRILITTAMFGLAVGVAYGCLHGYAYGFADGLVAGLTAGFSIGVALGLAIGLINEAGFSRGRTGPEPGRLRLGWPRRDRAQRSSTTYLKRSASEFASGLAIGLVFGLTSMLARVLTYKFTDGHVFGLRAADMLMDALTPGLAFGLMYGLVHVVVSALGENPDSHATHPWTLLTRDRTITLVRTSAAVLAVGLAVRFSDSLADGVVAGLRYGPEAGLVAGLIGGAGRLSLSAWGNWLLFARLWLPLTGRLPWRTKRFLEDAHARGVLRTAGAAYQFRHARLRDQLAHHYRT